MAFAFAVYIIFITELTVVFSADSVAVNRHETTFLTVIRTIQRGDYKRIRFLCAAGIFQFFIFSFENVDPVTGGGDGGSQRYYYGDIVAIEQNVGVHGKN